MRRLGPAVVLALTLTLLPVQGQAAAAPRAAGASAPIPVLAYYYIWFNATSWNRAKRDFPSAGRYTSDEPSVMRQHIRAAQAAGITGFLVSWKDTPQLDERLDKLVRVAAEERFTLGIVYQGLDVVREPLPVTRVRNDLVQFSKRWGSNPVFDLFGRPLVVWAGTWRFTTSEVDLVSKQVRPGSSAPGQRAADQTLVRDRSARGRERLLLVLRGPREGHPRHEQAASTWAKPSTPPRGCGSRRSLRGSMPG